MGCDPFSPVFLAQINVLCLPAARISKHRFDECVTALKSCAIVRVAASKCNSVADSDNRIALDHSLTPVLLNITDSYGFDTSQEGAAFETNREPQIVLGLVAGEDNLQQTESDYLANIELTAARFKEHASGYANATVVMTLVLGGSSVTKLKSCLWVDFEGSGPSLPDTMTSLVKVFHDYLHETLDRARSRLVTSASVISPSDRNSMGTTGSMKAHTRTSQEQETVGKANETPSRLSIVYGLINLQAGRGDDALRLLSEGAASSRDNNDHIWYARALEGLLTCMLMLSWARRDFVVPQICHPLNDKQKISNDYSQLLSTITAANRSSTTSVISNTADKPLDVLTGLVLHLVSTIIGLFERTPNSLTNRLSFDAVSEARIRWVNLLIMMKINGSSFNLSVLQSLFEGADPGFDRSFKSTAPSLDLRKSSLLAVLRGTALEVQVKLPIQRVMTIHLAIARSLSVLGVERQQGFHTQHVLQMLSPALIDARRQGAAEVGVHPASNLPQLSGPSRLTARGGVRDLLTSIATIYGLPTRHDESEKDSEPAADRVQKSLQFWSETHADGDLFMKLEVLSTCIELSDAIPDPESSLYFTSCLLQASRNAVTVDASTKRMAPLIAPTDLPRLLQNMRRAIGAAEAFGSHGTRAQYWDKFLVRDVHLLEDSATGRLMPHAARDLSVAVSADGVVKKDPFIFNPFAKARSSVREDVVSVGDSVHFSVILQNPLDVEIEIEKIHLVTEGSDFTPAHHSIVLGPLCAQAFVLSGRPEKPGSLKVVACRAMVRGCHEETFLILPQQWKAPRATKQRTRLLSHKTSLQIIPPKAKELVIKVVEPLPTLSITQTSLLQSSLMLLEGESQDFELTLRNDSDIDIDFVLLTFDDTVTKKSEEALNNKSLSPAEIYEIQYQMASVRPIRWKNETSGLSIAALASATFILEVVGKPGLGEINIMIDYACLNRPRSEVTETFYTRQLHHTLTMTVNGSIDITRCMVLPKLTPSNNSRIIDDDGYEATNAQLSDLRQEHGTSGHCILSLDVRNVWPQPLVVDLQAARRPTSNLGSIDEDAHDGTTMSAFQEVLQPGQVKKAVLQIPRIFLTDPQAIVPNLDTSRQFVVSASRMTLEAEIASREAFWYRERLLSYLRGGWREQNGVRGGHLDVRRAIRLAPKMVDALRIDLIEASVALQPGHEVSNDGEFRTSVETSGESLFRIQRNTFASITTTIHNRSSSDMSLILRLQPALRNQSHTVALDQSKHFAWSGTLQRALHPPLRAGESRAVDLGVVILAAGQYEVGGTIEELQSRSSRPNEVVPGVETNNERRVWHVRKPCMINVFDEQDD